MDNEYQNNNNHFSLFSSIPKEITKEILSFVGIQKSVLQVCKLFNAIQVDFMKEMFEKLKIEIETFTQKDETFFSAYQRLQKLRTAKTSCYLLFRTHSYLYDPIGHLNAFIQKKTLQHNGLFASLEECKTSLKSATYKGARYIYELKMEKSEAEKLLKEKRMNEFCYRVVAVHAETSSENMNRFFKKTVKSKVELGFNEVSRRYFDKEVVNVKSDLELHNHSPSILD